MSRRHPSALPRRWLMTDERMGDGLWDALARLPCGSGVVFRHYSLPAGERRALFEAIRRIARKRRLMLVWAGPHRAFPSHGRQRGALTAPVHSRREAVAAVRAGAKLLFVSPVHATRSHPGARALGVGRFGLMIRGLEPLNRPKRRFPAKAGAQDCKRCARNPGPLRSQGDSALRIAVIALGGMDERRWHALRPFGVHGWAGIDAWLPEDPKLSGAARGDMDPETSSG